MEFFYILEIVIIFGIIWLIVKFSRTYVDKTDTPDVKNENFLPVVKTDIAIPSPPKDQDFEHPMKSSNP